MALWTRKRESQPESAQAEARHFLIANGQVRSLADPEDWLRELFGVALIDGIPTGDHAAKWYSASAAAIRLIATSVAECPVHAFRNVGDGKDRNKERLRDHPIETLFNGYPNPWQLAPGFLRKMTETCLLEGNAFARIVRVRGVPREIHQIANGAVKVEVDEWTSEPRYVVSKKGGGSETLSYRDILRLESPTGDAPAKQAAKAIHLGLTIEKATSELFRNGGQPVGILSVKGKLTAKSSQDVLEAWKLQRTENPGGASVLGEDAKWTPITFSSVDAQTLELRKNQVIDVLRFFGISPTLAGELADASLNNSESLGKQYLAFTLGPWLSAWVDAISVPLIDPEDRTSVYVEFETAAVTSGDFKSVSEGLKNLAGGPVLTPNDARARLNLPRIDGGDKLYPVAGASPKATGNNNGDSNA
ncbi:phage portal protein [Rhizobium puerariae]|uniref:Phage portal protein n=1 Tax=Rhizobium puerariae TaxID=1585791 RepID=A0ABV6ANK3_9HYPH